MRRESNPHESCSPNCFQDSGHHQLACTSSCQPRGWFSPLTVGGLKPRAYETKFPPCTSPRIRTSTNEFRARYAAGYTKEVSGPVQSLTVSITVFEPDEGFEPPVGLLRLLTRQVPSSAGLIWQVPVFPGCQAGFLARSNLVYRRPLPWASFGADRSLPLHHLPFVKTLPIRQETRESRGLCRNRTGDTNLEGWCDT